MVGTGRLHHHHQRVRIPPGRRLALRHARTGRPRLSEPHHLRRNHCARAASPIATAAATTSSRCSSTPRSHSRTWAARPGSPGAAHSRPPRSARASSRNTAPTRAWCRPWRGSPITWRRRRSEPCAKDVEIYDSARKASRMASALMPVIRRSVSACAFCQTG